MADTIMEFEQHKKEFIDYTVIRGLSPETSKTYNFYLNFYKKYLLNKQVKQVEFYSVKTLINYNLYLLDYRKKNGAKISDKTRQNALSALSSFYNYLESMDYIFTNPFELIGHRKRTLNLPKKIINEKQFKKLINSIDITTPHGYRNRTIVEVLYSTGIRRGELSGLSVYDIDLNNGFMRVTGKGSKTRIVPVGKIACHFLENYINNYRMKLLKNKEPTEALFVSVNGNRLINSSLGSIIYLCMKKADLKGYSCHSFRHACATEMLKGKANIKAVQEMLGHACLSATQIYTQVLPLDLLEVHKKTHPSWNLFDE